MFTVINEKLQWIYDPGVSQEKVLPMYFILHLEVITSELYLHHIIKH